MNLKYVEVWDLVLIWVTVGHLSGRVEENYEETQQDSGHLKKGPPITQQEFLRLTINFEK
jgi:hypothetical protein